MLEVRWFSLPLVTQPTDVPLVGFTGSGQQMRKDPSRSRHIYQQSADDEGV